jgi:hypothetical protein
MCMVLFISCESKDKYVGVYQAEAKRAESQETIVVELKANGDGVWKMPSDEAKGTFVEVPFTWYIKRGDLRVNTKAGGVIVGKIDKDTIRMTLPGPRVLTFRRIQ